MNHIGLLSKWTFECEALFERSRSFRSYPERVRRWDWLFCGEVYHATLSGEHSDDFVVVSWPRLISLWQKKIFHCEMCSWFDLSCMFSCLCSLFSRSVEYYWGGFSFFTTAFIWVVSWKSGKPLWRVCEGLLGKWEFSFCYFVFLRTRYLFSSRVTVSGIVMIL